MSTTTAEAPKSPATPDSGTTAKKGFDAGYLVRWAIPLIIGLVIWFVPVPEGVKPQGMHMLAIFVFTIIALITQPLPTGSVSIIGLAAAMILNVMPMAGQKIPVAADLTKAVQGLSVDQAAAIAKYLKSAVNGGTAIPALAGFQNSTVWLIVAAFFLSEGFLITGLGRRIALLFTRSLGKSSLGLSYGMAITDLVLAPFTPSNTARAGGVIYPIIRSLAELEDSHPTSDESRKRLGSFMMMTAVVINTITSAMFLTAMAGNPVSQLAANSLGLPNVNINWTNWALGAVVPGLISLIVIPLIMYKIYAPTLKHTPEAPAMAIEELRKIGAVTKNEIIMIVTFVVLLILWIFGNQNGTALGIGNINATAAAFFGILVLLVTKVLTWKDMANNKSAWQTLIFFGVLVGMADYLNVLGVVPWVGRVMASAVQGWSWVAAFALLALVYFYVHYLFASNTAQITAMYAVFLTTSIAAGAPPLFAAMMLAYIGNLFGALTHYASGPCGVFFGSGYIKTSEWFRTAFIMSIPVLLIWGVIGTGWMKLVGIWG